MVTRGTTGRIVDAAVQLAADRGIEHLTLRAAADVAGMSWDTARESFYDHADLLRAVSTAVTRRNVPVDDVDLTVVPGGESFEDRALAVAHGFWDQLTADRELQLVSYEILASRCGARRCVRSPPGQQEDQRDLAAQVLTEFAERDGVMWDRPVAEVARFVATFLDGLTTSWMIDGDDDAAAAQLDPARAVSGDSSSRTRPDRRAARRAARRRDRRAARSAGRRRPRRLRPQRRGAGRPGGRDPGPAGDQVGAGARALVERALAMPGLRGLMAYSLARGAVAASRPPGARATCCVGYPMRRPGALTELAARPEALAAHDARGRRRAQLDLVAAAPGGSRRPGPSALCLDVDASLRLGARRRRGCTSASVARRCTPPATPPLSPRGRGDPGRRASSALMFYEAQVAGLPGHERRRPRS